jgi:hypothetical protein
MGAELQRIGAGLGQEDEIAQQKVLEAVARDHRQGVRRGRSLISSPGVNFVPQG